MVLCSIDKYRYEFNEAHRYKTRANHRARKPYSDALDLITHTKKKTNIILCDPKRDLIVIPLMES